MKRSFYIGIWAAALLLSACQGKAGETAAADTAPALQTEAQAPSGEETEAEIPVLGEAPEETEPVLSGPPKLCLSDTLSSIANEFFIQPGNYSWTVLEDGEEIAAAACGSAPLDADPERADILAVPDYAGQEGAPYSLSFKVQPDRVTVTEWERLKLGDPDAEADASETYEEALFVQLEPGKVYQITAVWDEGKKAERGFFGEAEYVVLTE